jgi:hypothetical protein
MPPLIAAIVRSLRDTLPFASLPAMSRPLDELAYAHDYTLLALRLPLHHRRLRKARPKPKLYDAAIQPGLAILGAFAQQMGTRQAIVRLEDGAPSAISFQPRPFEANWTREHALSPHALADPTTDRLLLSDTLPRVSTGDMLHLAAKVALAVVDKTEAEANGTATFQFVAGKPFRPMVRVVYRPKGANATRPEEHLRLE